MGAVALARALAKEVVIAHPVPTRWYQAVAEVLSLVYKLRKKAGWEIRIRGCSR